MRLTFVKLGLLSLFLSSQLHAESQDFGKKRKSRKVKNRNTPSRLLVSWTKKPGEQINIGFEPRKDSKLNYVVYDEASKQGEDPSNAYTFSKKSNETFLETKCSRYSPNKFRYVSTTLIGLKPDTKYYFRTVSDGVYSDELYFITGPKESTSFKLISGGDSRSDRDTRVKMNRIMRGFMERDPSYRGLVHGGDYVYSGSSCTDWSEWLDDHQETITSDNRVLPIVPTFGNHENGGESIYKRLFPHPQGSESFYYNISFGMLDFVILNSEVSTEGSQKTFLKNSLENLSKKNSFKVVGYHRPAFPAVKRPASTTSFTSLLEQYNVPLVLESDGHALKQTCPVRNGRCEQGGVVYVGEGGLGVSQRNAGKSYKWYFDGGYAFSQHHVQSIEIDVEAKKMTYQVYFDGNYNYPIHFNL